MPWAEQHFTLGDEVLPKTAIPPAVAARMWMRRGKGEGEDKEKVFGTRLDQRKQLSPSARGARRGPP